MENKKKHIGKSLQAMRKAAGYKSAAAFAERMGWGVAAYTEYEQGRHMFNYEQAWEMADVLQCSLDDLADRPWPPGGQDFITPEEQALVEDFRKMDEEDRPGFVSTAHALAFAGEAKKEGAARPVVLDGEARG